MLFVKPEHINKLAVSLKKTSNMIDSLLDIFDLEDSGRLEDAFDSYQKIYSKMNLNYDIWKNYYFLLWDLIEDGSSDFQTRINLGQLFIDILKDGQEKFNELADFNFIAV